MLAGMQVCFSDNDKLSALVSSELDADLLILLSDIDGLYTADPHKHKDATLIPTVTELTPAIRALGEGAGSALGTGGMATKLRAAALCAERGCDMVIASGEDPEILYDILDGVPVGTRFLAKKEAK